MKKSRLADRLLLLAAALLLVLLAFLTLWLISAFRQNSRTAADFDLTAAISNRNTEEDIATCLLPEFAGISVDGERLGLVGSENAMRELTRTLAPLLSEALSSGSVREGSEEEWAAFAEAENSVYLRLHSELGDAIVSLFTRVASESLAGASFRTPPEGSGSSRRMGYLSEIVLHPYARGENFEETAFRSADGTVRIVTVTMPNTILSAEDLSRFVGIFRGALRSFAFRRSAADGRVQPVVTDQFFAPCVLMTENTASFVMESVQERNAVLTLFGLNPDKLLSAREESDGATSYVATRGEIIVGETSLTYRATSESGIGLAALTGNGESGNLANYVSAALRLYDGIKAANRHLAGGDASLLLTSVYAAEGTVRLVFHYVYDNIRVIADRPAFTAEFENGLLRAAELYTVSVQSLGNREEVMAGSWFYRWMEAKRGVPGRVFLTYRADFLSESVAPEWAGE
ncbi:MAG: hypothetical protein II779_10070 [Clostridia bacterium]|nr:hypothetical protein [Clostridia bacterium]